MSTMLSISLSKAQAKTVVNQTLSGITHKEAVELLHYLVVANFHTLDHVKLVRDFQKIVIKECNLSQDYFEENP